MDLGTSYLYPNAVPRGHYLSSSAFSTYAAGSTDYGFWLVYELSRTAGLIANGTTTLRLRNHGFLNHSNYPVTQDNDTAWYDDTA